MLTSRPSVPGSPEMPEVVLNLWYFLDKAGDVVQRLAGRAYALAGSDDQKLAALHKLAETDFHVARLFAVPQQFEIVAGPGKLKGATGPEIVARHPVEVFREVIDALEKDLPTHVRTVRGEPQTYRLRIRKDPLMVCTCVAERENGTLAPVLASGTLPRRNGR